MPPDKPHRRHLSSSEDLVTTYERRRAGFVALILERTRRATPFVAQARALKSAALQAQAPADLLNISEIQPALETAAGISDKAAGHVTPEDKEATIRELIEKYLEPAGPAFVEELVYRFLLTKGDTLGGSMRNVGGAVAQQKFSRALVASITLSGVPYRWYHPKTKKWSSAQGEDDDFAARLKGISWSVAGKSRTIVYDRKLPIVGNNVDLLLLDCSPEELGDSLKVPARYLALGELKGGIDPAGADEHWKTARTALSRIKDAFSEHHLTPHTFFIGAAIEQSMANEIWSQLEDGTLSNAANLTDPDQVASICRWVANL